MNSPQSEGYLAVALKRLETAYKEILKSQGYSKEVERIKILAEMVKEQLPHENTNSSAS